MSKRKGETRGAAGRRSEKCKFARATTRVNASPGKGSADDVCNLECIVDKRMQNFNLCYLHCISLIQVKTDAHE